jgi:sec-independent protein translocase protein TatB
MVTPPTIEVANLGMADTLILMVMALVVFGPRRLPQIGRQIGKLMFEFRKASNDFKFQMEEELRIAEDADRKKQEEERQRALALNVPAQESVSAQPPAAVNAIESPYAGEGKYPELSAPAAEKTEEATPRILPPSTGDTVPSTRPSRLAGLAESTRAASDGVEAVAIEQTPEQGIASDSPAETVAPEQTASEPETVRPNG